MPEGKKFQVRFEFTKKSDAGKKVQEAESISFKLREGKLSEINFTQEAEYLAATLKLIFPGETLAFLKQLLPDH